MKKYEMECDYQEFYEYHGNTEIERIRKQANRTVLRDWIVFDSVDEAMTYFNDRCGEFMD